MKERIFDLLNPTRKLKQLSVLFALVLLPMGAWGQATISVAGYMSDANGDFSGPNITKGEVHFDAPTNTLTLTDAEITGDIELSNTFDSFTIEVIGSNTLTGNITYTFPGGQGTYSTITFKRGNNTQDCSLTIVCGEYPIAGFSDYLNPGLDGFSWYHESNTNVYTIATDYNLTVGDIAVTSANAVDVLGDNHNQIRYDAANSILTLDGAFLYGDGKNIVYFGSTALTIALNGSCYVNSIVCEGQEKPNLTFKKTDDAIPGTMLRTTSDFRTHFSTVNYDDWLGLHIDDSYGNDIFYDVMSKTPSIYGNWNGNTEKWNIEITSKFEGTVKYSLTYADENLAANNKTNTVFEDAFELLGPATIKATITIDNQVSPEETTYYFGVMPNPLQFEYNGETAPDFAATLYPNVEGVTFTPYSSPGSFITFSEGNVTINGFGSGLAYASLNLPELRTFSTITDSIAFKMEVVPAAPTVSLAAGTYQSTSDPIQITGTGLDNTKIMYKWDDGDALEYSGPIDIQAGTLTTWEEYTPASGGPSLKGKETTVAYSISYNLDVTFVGSNSWATYYGQENLDVPEGLTAYVVSAVNENSGEVTVNPTSYIPKYEAVLLQRAANAPASGYTTMPYKGEEAEGFVNKLEGSSQEVSVADLYEGLVSGGAVYVLYNDVFKKTTSGTIPAHRGYMLLGDPAMSRLTIVEGTTAIGMLEVGNGNDIWSAIDGRQLNGQPQRAGLYLKNGKKVFVTNNK